MIERLTVVGLAAASFFATSLDNFTLLVGFFSDPRFSRRRVLLGYLVSTLGVVMLAYALSTGVELAPDRALGFLGVVPLGFGLQGLYRLWRPGTDAEQESPAGGESRGLVAVFLVMLANSGDTLGVFVSLFADTAEGLEFWVLVTAVSISALYGGAAVWLVNRKGVVAVVQRVTRVVLPFLLIAIGLYILANTRTDVLP